MLQAKLLTVYPFVQEHIAAQVVPQSPDVSKLAKEMQTAHCAAMCY
jgi:hypothetical protein